MSGEEQDASERVVEPSERVVEPSVGVVEPSERVVEPSVDGDAGPGAGKREYAGLTAEELEVLEFEKNWRGRSTRKNEAIRRLGMSPSHYYLVLGRAVDKPEAVMGEPELIRRLRRLREQRAAERHGTRNSSRLGSDGTEGDAIG